MNLKWTPALVLGAGIILLLSADRQRAMPLDRPLGQVIPTELQGYFGEDLTVSDEETEVAGFSNYLFRVYRRETPASAVESQMLESDQAGSDTEFSGPDWFSIYVGYYESQAQGNTIHSPKNCLPGAGWEALSAGVQTVQVGGETLTVNRYLLQNENERSLALYWYQGRGRITHSEYGVKLNLFLDAALKRRSDEALVRIVFPIERQGAEDPELAGPLAEAIIRYLEEALPD